MVEVRELLCKHLHNPLGIGLNAPFFQWKISSSKKNVQQTAFNIQVAKSDDFSTIVWESGWVESDTLVHIVYQGEPLESMTRYYWRVRIKDESGQNSDWSETAFFETGLRTDDWRAHWIEPEKEVDPKAFKPAPFLRNEFIVDEEINDAKLYITAHGLYEAYLNGKRIGEQIFMPGNTDVANRLQYQVYDVGHLLEGKKNCFGVILGDGWYRGSINVGSLRNAHGDKIGLLAQLKITYSNGDTDYFITDKNWKTVTGPIIKSDMKKGEVYDARHDLPGWNEFGYDDRHWKGVQVAHHGLDNLIPSEGAPVRKMEVIKPLEIIHTPKGETVIDFGQNIAGIVKMKVQGDRGTTVRLRHTEVLDKDGNFTDSYFGPSVGGLFQQLDEYTLSGDGIETYEPHFTVHGFRYVKVEEYPGKFDSKNFEAIAIYSDMGETGIFECSNPKLNQLYKNIIWTMKGNFLDIPTDCPTRERAGWTGDAQIFVHTGSLLMNDAAFYAKWIKDVSSQQHPDGKILNVVPDKSKDSKKELQSYFNLPPGSAGWGDAVVIIPWTLYEMFGDISILENQYESMKRWVEYERRNAEKRHWTKTINPVRWMTPNRNKHQRFIWDTKFHLGEWLEPDMLLKDVWKVIFRNIILSDPIVATAYFKHSACLLGKAAGVLGKVEDEIEYLALAENIRQAFIKEFIGDDGTMKIYPKRQAPYVRALAFELFTDDLREKIEEQLIERVEEKERHLFTGFLSTPFLLSVLSEAGETEMAYDILLQEDNPSWLYAINKGATTIWEDWEGISEEGVPTASQNHYSKGAVASWFFEYICGIQLDHNSPAYKHFYIKPNPGGGLSWAKATFDSPYGEIQSRWEKDETSIQYTFSIPTNASATVVLKNAGDFSPTEDTSNLTKSESEVCFDLSSGTYQFNVNL